MQTLYLLEEIRHNKRKLVEMGFLGGINNDGTGIRGGQHRLLFQKGKKR